MFDPCINYSIVFRSSLKLESKRWREAYEQCEMERKKAVLESKKKHDELKRKHGDMQHLNEQYKRLKAKIQVRLVQMLLIYDSSNRHKHVHLKSYKIS